MSVLTALTITCAVILGMALLSACVHFAYKRLRLPEWIRRKKRYTTVQTVSSIEITEIQVDGQDTATADCTAKVPARALAEAGSRAAASHNYAAKYQREHPADISEGLLSSEEVEYVIENGVDAWKLQLEPEAMPHVEIMDGQDVTFRGGEVSVMSNLQFPNEQLVYYFEVKVEVLPTGTDLAVGISMRPYPPLRMAGWADNSVAYHTLDGGVIFSCGSTNAVAAAAGDTATMPGDTIGFGWRPRSGKLFVTRNGEFIAKHQVPWARKRLYPVVSADGPCKVSVNFGSRGFVLAKANTNCWGLAPPQGLGPPPPMYGCDDESILLAYTPLGQLEQQQRPGHSSHGSQGSSLSLGSMAFTLQELPLHMSCTGSSSGSSLFCNNENMTRVPFQLPKLGDVADADEGGGATVDAPPAHDLEGGYLFPPPYELHLPPALHTSLSIQSNVSTLNGDEQQPHTRTPTRRAPFYVS